MSHSPGSRPAGWALRVPGRHPWEATAGSSLPGEQPWLCPEAPHQPFISSAQEAGPRAADGPRPQGKGRCARPLFAHFPGLGVPGSAFWNPSI